MNDFSLNVNITLAYLSSTELALIEIYTMNSENGSPNNCDIYITDED